MILVVDTATSRALLAGGTLGGALVAVRGWTVGYRHGETLLPTLGPFLLEAGSGLGDLEAIVVGTGPGAFTGLRVGIATAKGLAHALRRPIVGIGTGEAFLRAARTGAAGAEPIERPVLLLPAGPNDRVLVRPGEAARLLPGGMEPDLDLAETLVAVDLDGRAPDEAVARGEGLRDDALAAALLELGARRLADGRPDDLARLVPEYVTLPRGVSAASGEVTWSRGPR